MTLPIPPLCVTCVVGISTSFYCPMCGMYPQTHSPALSRFVGRFIKDITKSLDTPEDKFLYVYGRYKHSLGSVRVLLFYHLLKILSSYGSLFYENPSVMKCLVTIYDMQDNENFYYYRHFWRMYNRFQRAYSVTAINNYKLDDIISFSA